MTGFQRLATIPVPAFSLTVETWRHVSGLTHYHLACADEHRACTVAVRTQPADSTGMPHILEHTTLCGSRRYPVRDPFFNMLRRSLQTFMNAMTFPDLTAYPFATQVGKDFSNLLDVYLDAVFAPNLHPLDFAQEGHRLEPKDGAFARAGVVYNEMQGAMDSTDAQVEQATARALLADTCYAHNYGGDPAVIPQLAHTDLVAFHRRCYAPANAVIITYGALEPADLHARLQPYLHQAGSALPPPPLSRQPGAPQTIDVPVPWGEGQDVEDVTGCSITWVQGDLAELDEVLACELVDRLLLGHAGAPLKRALEGSGLGRSTGSSGYGTGYRNGLFTAELEGLAEADYPKLPILVDDVLKRLARDGLSPAEIEAALHQQELSRREVHGDSYPYGLELSFRLLTPWNLGADPLPFLDQGPALARLRQEAQRPGWIQEQIRRRFVDNPRRATFHARPDRTFHQRRAEAELAATRAAVAQLDAAGTAALHAAAAALAQRQQTKDDATVLPDLALADVPAQRGFPTGREDGRGLTVFSAGTNGLLHLTLALPVPALTPRELDLLPLLAGCIGSTGVGAEDYAATAARLNATCGSLGAWTDFSNDADQDGLLHAFLLAEVKGLASRHGEVLPLLLDSLQRTRFDEGSRLRDLIDQGIARLSDRVTSSGNRLAAAAAARGCTGAAGLSHRFSGLGRLTWLKRTAATIATDAAGAGEALERLGGELTALRYRLLDQPRHWALIGDWAERAEVLAAARAASRRATADGASPSAAGFTAPPPSPSPATCYTTATAVNYCALGFPAVTLGHADAAPLAVAGRLLTNQVLHPKLREQGGAYGGGAGYAGTTGTFTLSSYRDPRLDGTFADMREGLRWLRDCPQDRQMLKEAILGVLAGLDAPGSPAGESRSRWASDLKRFGPARLNAYRQAILATTIDQVRHVAHRWLDPTGGTPAVICSTEAARTTGWAVEAI